MALQGRPPPSFLPRFLRLPHRPGADQVYPEHTGNMWTGRAVTGASDLQEGSVGIGHPLFPVCPLCSGCQGRILLRFPQPGWRRQAVGLETSRHGSPSAKNRRDNGQSRLISHLSQTKQNPPGWWLRSLGPGYKTRRGRPTHARDMIEQKGGNNGRDLSREGHVNLVPWVHAGDNVAQRCHVCATPIPRDWPSLFPPPPNLDYMIVCISLLGSWGEPSWAESWF